MTTFNWNSEVEFKYFYFLKYRHNPLVKETLVHRQNA